MSKNLFLRVAALLIVMCLLTVNAPITGFALETYDEVSIPVRTIEELYNIRDDLTAKYVLMNDIDLTSATAKGGDWDFAGRGWNPIGSDDIYAADKTFSGTFDGNGHSIRGMRIEIGEMNQPQGSKKINAGLFSNVSGEVKNLDLIDCSISTYSGSDGTCVGILAAENSGNISNCTVSGNSKGLSYYGGYGYAGGMIGINSGIIQNCGSSVNVYVTGSAYSYAGGIAACSSRTGKLVAIQNCFNKGKVYATATVSPYQKGDLITTDAVAGGIVGESFSGVISQCYNNGNIESIVSTTISKYSKFWAYAGGIAGLSELSYQSIIESYNSGNVSAQAQYPYAGGIAGRCPEAKNCYNIGTTSASRDSSTGAGYGISFYSNCNFENCYYLSESGINSKGAMALTAGQMKLSSMFRGFDFDTIWQQNKNAEYPYPQLQLLPQNLEEAIQEISILSLPKKLSYYCGEAIDIAGGTIQITYVSGDTVELPLSVEMITGYDPNRLGSQTLTVTYQGKTTTFVITIYPSAPTVTSKTDTTVILTAVEGYEYRMDNGIWQKSNVFTGLTPNSKHDFYQRVAETDSNSASQSSLALSITTDKTNAPNPITPILSDKTDTTVTLKVVAGYEYRMDNGAWQRSNVFTGLAPNSTHNFCQRVAETDTSYASDISLVLSVTTDKTNMLTPGAPILLDRTDTTVTLKAVSGYEYRMDNGMWQKNNVFTGLAPHSEHSFYQRIAETGTSYASGSSLVLLVTTYKTLVNTPNAPTLKGKTDTTVTLNAIEGYEYRMDNGAWQASPIFTSLAPISKHNFYQRVAETDSYAASQPSPALSVTTNKTNAPSPIAPVLSGKTDTTVTLKAVVGYEYRMDSGAWQKSNVFTGLAPNSTHNFCQRVAETDTNYASNPSTALSVTTNKTTPPTPTAPILSGKTDTTVTLKAFTGYEYRMDNGEWQQSPVFTGLAPNSTHQFYQRIAKTDTAYPSDSSPSLEVQIYISGDLNHDGKITAADALMTLQISVGKLQPDEEQAKAADVDGEDGVTATDALLILQYAVGKIEKFPVSKLPKQKNIVCAFGIIMNKFV